MKKKVNTLTKSNVNQHILNIITTSGLDYTDTTTNLGDNVGKICCISKYPSPADYGWLANLCNLEGTSTVMEYRHTDASNLINVFNKRISDLRTDRTLAKEESEKQQLDQKIEDLKKLIHQLGVAQEPVGYVNIMLHIQACDTLTLQNRYKRVSSAVQLAGCNLRPLKYKQLQALQCMSPYGIPNRMVSNIGDRNMPISSFIGGFPMANTGINDMAGHYLGKSKNGKLVILDMWKRGKDRTNCNWFISGIPGVGKSTFIKLLSVSEYASGTKMIFFDPEREYHDIANHPDVNGAIIDAAGGVTGRINPLQIRSAPIVTPEDLLPNEKIEDFLIYEEGEEGEGLSELALHIQNLRVFLKLYFGAKDYSAGIATALEQALIDTYQKFGIDWHTDISKLKNEDYPLLSDVYRTIEEYRSAPDLSNYKKDIYDKLCDLLFSAAKGADQFLWNGYTTITAEQDFIVIDASRLLDLDEKVQRAQFFNLIMWAWQQMSSDRSIRSLFGLDEGYLFVDPDNPDLMKYLRNFSKRLRKYEGGLIFITHSAVDVLDPAVKRFGQAIIDNGCYKFIMGCDSKNLKETTELFDLSPAEMNVLASKARGKGILMAGSTRLELSVDVYPEILKMFGTAGGR